MRSISVSTEVFAAIWAARQPEEETEDEILRRVLGRPAPKRETTGGPFGFYDRRYDVRFPEAFEVFRTYLGRDYRAHATGGMWLLLNDGKRYGGLNELSQAIGTKNENAWINWFFTAPSGERKRVSDLRDPSRIHSRRPRPSALEIDVSDL